MDWRKSSYSGANGGQCVEVASAEDIAVRDTVDRAGVTLQFSPKAWQQFTRSLRSAGR
jgi:Domain of unknown function (DUF397)